MNTTHYALNTGELLGATMIGQQADVQTKPDPAPRIGLGERIKDKLGSLPFGKVICRLTIAAGLGGGAAVLAPGTSALAQEQPVQAVDLIPGDCHQDGTGKFIGVTAISNIQGLIEVSLEQRFTNGGTRPYVIRILSGRPNTQDAGYPWPSQGPSVDNPLDSVFTVTSVKNADTGASIAHTAESSSVNNCGLSASNTPTTQTPPITQAAPAPPAPEQPPQPTTPPSTVAAAKPQTQTPPPVRRTSETAPQTAAITSSTTEATTTTTATTAPVQEAPAPPVIDPAKVAELASDTQAIITSRPEVRAAVVTPEDGDNSNMLAWLAAAGATITIGTGAIMAFRRRKDEESGPDDSHDSVMPVPKAA